MLYMSGRPSGRPLVLKAVLGFTAHLAGKGAGKSPPPQVAGGKPTGHDARADGGVSGHV